MKLICKITVCSIVIISLTACFPVTDKPRPPTIIALVNGFAIKEDDLRFVLKLERSKFGDDAFNELAHAEELKMNYVDRMVQKKVIADWGRSQGIILTNEELATGLKKAQRGYSEHEFKVMLDEKQIPYARWAQMTKQNLLIEKVMNQSLKSHIKISSHKIRNYYQKNLSEFQRKESVRVRHIVTDTEEKAKHILEKLKNKANFAKLAIVHSLSPDRSDGGDLGFFERGTHPIEFDNTCFKLKKGEISDIVKSPYGYHIFKLIDKRPKQTISFKKAKDKITARLIKQKVTQLFDPWYQSLLAKAQVQIFKGAVEQVEVP